MKLKLICVGLALIFLAGCAGKKIPLDRDTFTERPIVKVQTIDPFQELQIEQANSGANGGASFGLLGAAVGALVDAGVNSSRKKSMADLRFNMSDYDMQEVFDQKLTAAFVNSRLSNATVEPINAPEAGASNELQSRVPRILISSTLSADRLRLVTEGLAVYREDKDVEETYRRAYVSVHDLSKIGITKSTKGKTAELANKTDEIKELLDQSFDELITLFIDDYTDNKLKSLTAAERATPLALATNYTFGYHILTDNGKRVLLSSKEEIAPTMLYTDSAIVGKRKAVKKK